MWHSEALKVPLLNILISLCRNGSSQRGQPLFKHTAAVNFTFWALKSCCPGWFYTHFLKSFRGKSVGSGRPSICRSGFGTRPSVVFCRHHVNSSLLMPLICFHSHPDSSFSSGSQYSHLHAVWSEGPAAGVMPALKLFCFNPGTCSFSPPLVVFFIQLHNFVVRHRPSSLEEQKLNISVSL